MITEQMLDVLRFDMKAHLGKKRFLHTVGVEKEMRALAEIYMPSKIHDAACAGLLHDITKEFSYEQQIALAEKYKIEISFPSKDSAALFHSKTGAFFAKERYPFLVSDEIFSAIWKHTTASAKMSLMDKLLYLADFIEEGRTYKSCVSLRYEFYSGLENVIDDKLCFLNEIMIKAYDYSLEALKRDGLYISPSTLEAKEEAIKERFAYQGKK